MGAEKILVAEGRAVNTSDRAPAAARNKTEDEEECIKHHIPSRSLDACCNLKVVCVCVCVCVCLCVYLHKQE